MFRKILIATDNSALMDNIIEYTATLFPYSQYYVINVIDTSSGPVPMTYLLHETLSKISREAVDNAKKRLQDMGIDGVVKMTPQGKPSHEILSAIRKHEIELLVMATHAKSGTQRLHIGKTCRRCLRRVHCPVMIINKPPRPVRPSRILNPTSGSKYSKGASELAALLAEHFGAILTNLFIGPEEKMAESFDYVIGGTKSLGVKLNEMVCDSVPERCIIEETKKNDLLICSRGRRGVAYKFRIFAHRLALGKLERDIIAQGEIPLIMVND
ncbi:MAG: hypothetical protein CVT48_00670 [Thermoplasmata archaeon HGW-Thermoplasmata-1]|nr:MAG: hypothetical protein CVT48_00670 [Thermoplasmata archaeon HGW-Thermoplasmata-1]